MENEFENKQEIETMGSDNNTNNYDDSNINQSNTENENHIPFGHDCNGTYQPSGTCNSYQNQEESYQNNENNLNNQDDYYHQNAVYKAPDYGYHQDNQETQEQNGNQNELQNYNYGNNQNFYNEYNYQTRNNNQIPKTSNNNAKMKKIAIILGLVIVIGTAVGAGFKGIDMLINQQENTALYEDQQENNNQASIENNTSPKENSVNSGASSIGKTAVNPIIFDTTVISDIAEESMASMVSIDCTVTETYNYFGRDYSQDAMGSGSGFIIGENDNELFIATNNHVVEGANEIEITFIDEQKAMATTKGTDSAADLAVVSIQKSDLKKDTRSQIKIASLGESNDVRLGEMVVVIGNALGYGQSVTVGYVSARDREVEINQGEKMILLQTDAAINPGNSGGALLNLKGEVIGIPSVKYADSKVEGMGFAIPISRATPILDELMKRELLTEEEQGYLGVSCLDVTSDANSMYNIPVGVYVSEVSDDGAAKAAGVQVGDIITAINGIETSSKEALVQKVHSYRIGTEITLTIQRSSNGKYKEMEVKAKLKGKSTIDGLPGSDDSNSDASGNKNGQGSNEKDNNGSNGNGSSDNSGDIFGNGDDYYGNSPDDFFDFFNDFFN